MARLLHGVSPFVKAYMNIDELAHKPVGRLLWQYSLPAVVGMLVNALYNIVDRIYIGQGVGPEAISGLAITFPVMNLVAAMGVLIGAGASARTSIALGAGNRRAAEVILGNSLILTLVIGTAYVLVFEAFLDQILTAFGATAVTLPYAREFMLWIMPGLVITNICFSFNNIMRASGYPTRAMVTMILGAGLNIAIAPIFIFWLDLGIKGAAIANDISMTVSAAFVMWHFLQKGSTLHFTAGTYRPRPRVIWSIISIGAAPSLVNAAACLINMTVNVSLIAYGTDLDVGAAGIFITYTAVIVNVLIGINLGMQPIVGYNYGAGQLHRLRRTFLLACCAASAICIAGCLFGILFPRLIAATFTTDSHLIDITARGLSIALVMFWVVGFQVTATGFFQSIGRAAESIILSLCRQIIFMYPLLKLLPPYFGIDGVWMSFPISDALATIVTAAMIVWQFTKINRLTPAKQPAS